MSTYIVGIDLGRLSDRTALSVVQRHSTRRDLPSTLTCSYLRVWPPATHHTQVLDDTLRVVGEVLQGKETSRGYIRLSPKSVRVAIDITMAGAPTGQMFAKRFAQVGVRATCFTITGGTATEQSHSAVRVPKSHLASVLRVLLETKRLQVAGGLSLASVLKQEIDAFRVNKVTNDMDADWRERETDDLVLAVAIACWLHEYGSAPSFSRVREY